MQQHAMDAEHAEVAVVAAIAMAAVAYQVMELVLEVAADLAEAAGQRLAFQQRVARGGEAGRGLVQFAGGQPAEPRHRALPSAAQFLRHHQRDICNLVASATGVHLYTINHIMRHMIVRCRELNLRLTISEEEAKEVSIATLTMQVMQVLQTGYHRIPL